MSASGWPMAGQQPTPTRNNSGNRPPVCFKCGQEGHFVIACPNSGQQIPGDRLSASSGISKGKVKFNSKSSQKTQRFNKHKGAVNRHQLSKQPAILTQYFDPPLSPQIGNRSSSFPPPAVPYQQYPGPVPPPQNFPQQPAPYQPNQQFSAPGPQYPYHQQPPQQPYGGPLATPQYGPGYQAPQHNQYQQPNVPPQFTGPNYPNAPQQFGPPQPIKAPYPVQNGNFSGNLASAPPFQTFPKPWNNAPPVPTSRAPPPQRQQRNYSDPGFNSGTHGYQSIPYQASRERTGSQSYQQTPHTPSSNVGSAHQPTPRLLQSSPAIAPNLPKVSSTSSTPYARLGALDNDVIKEIKPKPLEEVEEPKATVKEEEEEQKEDGEVPEEGEREEESEEDDEDAILNWEYMAIFLEPARLETVALAQPLSTNFGMTPVPLLDPNSKNSISRYARKDNLKEFIRPITMAPQWSYIKDDPAFAELGLDCELIPLSDVPAWITARHGSAIVVDDPSQPSRKRSRSRSNSLEQGFQDEDKMERDNANLETVAPEEAPETHVQGPPSKRIKNEFAEAEKLAAPTTVHVTSPFNLGRAGTPCLTAEDDAWAPDPGEVAAKPMSPTEMLLASLGVTGSPKPPKQASPPPVEDAQQTPHNTNSGPSPNQAVNQPAAQAPTANFQGGQTPSNVNYGGSQPQSTFTGHPSNPPFANNQNRPPQYGPPANQPYTNGPQTQPQFAPPPNNYQNGAPANTGFGNPQFPNPQYGPHVPQQHGPPQYGPPVPPQNGNQQYRPPMNTDFGSGPPVNGQYGAGPQGPPQYNNNMPPQNVPYNGHQYNQAPQYNGAPAGPYGHQGNPQFANGPPAQQQYGPPQVNPQFVPGPPTQQQYGPPQQGNPQFGGGPPPQQYGAPHTNPQFGNGPPNQQQYVGAPQGNIPFGNGPPAQQQYGVAPQNNPQYSNGPPLQQQYGGPPQGNPQGNPQFGNGQPNQQQYGPTSQGNAPFPNAQQQQQYGGPQGNPQYGNAPPVQQPQSYDAAPPNGVFRQDSGYASARGSYSNGPGPNAFNNENKAPSQNQQLPPNDSNQPQQGPTTPHLKVEIPSTTSPKDNDSDDESLSPTSLEILGKLLPNRKLSSGRKAESKLKRPAPVVEAAYSRRW